MSSIDIIINIIHALLGLSILGLSIGSCVYLTRARLSKSRNTYRASLKTALVLEQFIFLPLLLVTFITGSLVVKIYDFNLYTPWITATYLFLSLAVLCRLMIFFLLNQHYAAIEDQKKIRFVAFYYLLQIVFWIFLGLIVFESMARPLSYL